MLLIDVKQNISTSLKVLRLWLKFTKSINNVWRGGRSGVTRAGRGERRIPAEPPTHRVPAPAAFPIITNAI